VRRAVTAAAIALALVAAAARAAAAAPKTDLVVLRNGDRLEGILTKVEADRLEVEVDRKPVASADDAATTLRDRHDGGHLLRVVGEHGARFVKVPNG